MWIWQNKDWPNFKWDENKLAPLLRSVRKLEGILQGKAELSGNPEQRVFDNLRQNILASAQLEKGIDFQNVDSDAIQFSLAKRFPNLLQQNKTTQEASDPLADGLVAIQMDVFENSQHELSLNRFFRWHVNLYSDLSITAGIRPGAINVGKLRDEDSNQLVASSVDKPILHFEAPPKEKLKPELEQFLHWYKQSQKDESIDPILRVALAHLWFMTLHPFDEGNTVLGRALIDVSLMQNNPQTLALYNFTSAMLDNKKDYSEMLQYTQRTGLDVTHWMQWFLVTLEEAMQTSVDAIDKAMHKTRFWQIHGASQLNKDQVKVLNRMLDGNAKLFKKGLSAAVYQRITRVSKATATRHLADMLKKQCIQKLPGGGRSTSYELRL